MLASCSKQERTEALEPQVNLNIVEFNDLDEFNNTVENLSQSSEQAQIA